MVNPKLIDLGVKKTEAEWLNAVDRFWLSATPELFKWLGWVASLVAITYVSHKSGDSIIKGLLNFCYIAMFFYFMAYFHQFTFINPPFLKNHTTRRLFSIFLSGFLAIAAGLLANEIVNMFANTKP